MQALTLDAPHRVSFTNVPDAMAKAGESLIKVDAVGICGSDMHAFHGRGPKRQPGLILGHEIGGTVVEGPLAGKRVAVNPLIHCEECQDCLSGNFNHCETRINVGFSIPGGFAQYMVLPHRALIEVSGDMNPVHIALTEPCATCLHAVALAQRHSDRPIREKRSLVIGGGAIGVLTALWLKSMGVEEIQIADTSAGRVDAAREAGFDAIDPSECQTNHYNLVFDAVGGPATRRLAVAAGRPGAQIVHIGLLDGEGNFDAARITRAEMSFLGSWCFLPDDLRASAKALHSGALGDLSWVDVQSLDAGPEVFDRLGRGEIASPKVVLRPNG